MIPGSEMETEPGAREAMSAYQRHVFKVFGPAGQRSTQTHMYTAAVWKSGTHWGSGILMPLWTTGYSCFFPFSLRRLQEADSKRAVAQSDPGSTESGTFGEGCGITPGQAGSHQCSPCPPRPFLSYQRMYYVFIYMLSSGPAWLGIILLVMVGLLPDVLKKVLCRQLWPTATERTQVRRLPSQASHFPLSVL